MALVWENRDEGIERGAFASFGLHAVMLALLLLLLPRPEPPAPLQDEGITVDIVPEVAKPSAIAQPVATPARIATKPDVSASVQEIVPPHQEKALAVVTSPEVAPALPKPDAFVEAGQLFSETVLSDPRSRRAREALRGPAGSERNLQLCDLEALEQVRRAQPGMRPDTLAPYAMAAEKVNGNSVEVRGGAFRSQRKWYNIQFKCGLDASSGKVASFAFLVGAAIPQREWQQHNLVADDGAADQ
ncbi:hypothetical protein GGE16_003309 [Rhizobium leguminosarum]|uniref:DUF930 domain-containing protein n=1 Tax=Rhizobium leguminosarum TaxID=384 RepID=A0AAE2SX90_RHILE|nr:MULTISPECIES: DUF930 domain-containing protein [Rhizobium]MBB4291250.1 hypothetical protein [Rhizobium leguminosarum]MBB4297654.1 hypothetical protein [Rhizobium leguminosarum]MBB4308794.1 hypothetical protein [Rhizobium leguminosarum]MBB4416629.1 hypothetical protein [Rhizobium leguminosarum]MBB4430403.1 hypothetical protein [Rhizobium esperanzae]